MLSTVSNSRASCRGRKTTGNGKLVGPSEQAELGADRKQVSELGLLVAGQLEPVGTHFPLRCATCVVYAYNTAHREPGYFWNIPIIINLSFNS